ncbi:MAG: DUF6477 family protein [Pseudomonadota bacterium]
MLWISSARGRPEWSATADLGGDAGAMTQETRPQNRLTAMARPKLLLRAARTYAKTCRRGETGPDTAQKRPADRALEALIAMEHTLETARRQRSPGYRSVRHVEVLAALLNARANQT